MGCDDVAAKRVAPALQAAAGAKLLACSRMQPMRLWDFQQRYCIREGCPDSAEIFADLEIDAVYLATPVFLHCLHTIEAAEQKQTNALRENHGHGGHGAPAQGGYLSQPGSQGSGAVDGVRIVGKVILVRTTLVEATPVGPAAWRFVRRGIVDGHG